MKYANTRGFRLCPWTALTLIKYLFSAAITLAAFQTCRSHRYLFVSLLELMIILGVTNLILRKSRVAGYLIQLPLLLIYNAQTLVMYFGGSFTSLIMLTNLVFLKDLQGKFLLYLSLIVPMAVLTLLPPRELRLPGAGKPAGAADRMPLVSLLATAVFSLAGVLAIAAVGPAWSPAFNLYTLGLEVRSYQELRKEAAALVSDGTEFYSADLGDHFAKPAGLADRPNVVLIFAEGLSHNIIHDDREIMPNLNAFEKQVLRFDNYYNHTFATLRGLIGQLYSGYQLENFDTNALVSMQSIFRDQGYRTAFINTEPANAEFTQYLEGLGFDTVVTDMELVSEKGSYIHDRDAFDLLLETVTAQHETGAPFFTAIYTFGTHMSLDTADQTFGDGSDDLLNRFYDLDFQFGRFLAEWKESPLSRDTLLIFTTDHATYADDDFLSAFPDYGRDNPCLDRIPLYFYCDGIEPASVDAGGRNSLDLAPTVFDYLDLSAPKYFLGQSLFAPPGESSLDTLFHESASVMSTKDNRISQLTEDQYAEFRTTLIRYSSAKGVTDIVPISEDQLLVTVSDDGQFLEVTLKTHNDYEAIWFPVWSDVDWQDDLIWHPAERSGGGTFTCTVDLSEHSGRGIINVHAYAGSDAPDTMVAVSQAYVSESGQ